LIEYALKERRRTLDWQKDTTADRAVIERRAASIGISEAVRSYFARVTEQWDGRDAIVESVGKAQFMRDAANILDEQVSEIESILRELKLSVVPNPDADVLKTPLEQGLYFVQFID